jgi:hypothetical protein
VKTPSGNLHFHSPDPASRGCGFPPVTTKLLAAQLANEKAAKMLETTVAVGIPCPLVLDCASTIHYAQGGTYSKNLYLDLHSMAGLRKDGTKTVLGIDATAAAILVALTRSNNSANVKLANIDGAAEMWLREQRAPSSVTGRTIKQMLDWIRTKYEYFR